MQIDTAFRFTVPERPPQQRSASWAASALAGVSTAGLLVLAPIMLGTLRAGAAGILSIGLLGLAAAVETHLSGRSTAAATPRRTALVSVLSFCTGALLFALSALPLTIARGALLASIAGPLTAGIVGSVMIVAGTSLRALSILRLGARYNSSNDVAADDALERAGIFRRLAHPSELGLLLIAAGSLALTGQDFCWLMMLPLYGLCTARLHLEEDALLRRHADAYRIYRRRTFDPFPSVLGANHKGDTA